MNMKTLLGFFVLITLLSGCSAKHVNEPLQNTTPSGDKQEAPKEDFISRVPSVQG